MSVEWGGGRAGGKGRAAYSPRFFGHFKAYNLMEARNLFCGKWNWNVCPFERVADAVMLADACGSDFKEFAFCKFYPRLFTDANAILNNRMPLTSAISFVNLTAERKVYISKSPPPVSISAVFYCERLSLKNR